MVQSAIEPLLAQTFTLHLSKGDQKKLQIIKTAIHCLAKNGMEGGTFASIATRLKTNRSHVAYYFKSRHELLGNCVKYVIMCAQEITVKNLRQASSPEEQLQAMVRSAFEWAQCSPEQVKVLLLFYYYGASNARLRELHTEIRKAGFERIVAILRSWGKSKAPDKEIERCAKAIQTVITGTLLEQLTVSETHWKFEDLAVETCLSLLRQLAGK